MLNVAAIMGRLTRDPELRQTPQGVSVTSFTVAVDRSYVRQGEDRQADFIDCVAWRSTADFVAKHFSKGSMIAVDGHIQTRRYQDKNGNNRTAVEIIADHVHFAGSKPAEHSAPADRHEYSYGNNDDFAVIEETEDMPF